MAHKPTALGEGKPRKRKPHFRRDARLICGVRSLEYDFDERTGILRLPGLHCCDMQGAIDLFSAIDKEVRLIKVFSGPKPDTTYKYTEDDGWLAYRHW